MVWICDEMLRFTCLACETRLEILREFVVNFSRMIQKYNNTVILTKGRLSFSKEKQETHSNTQKDAYSYAYGRRAHRLPPVGEQS